MKDDKNKARWFTIGIAVSLIVIICGITVIIQLVNRRTKEDSGSKLQAQIMEYADTTQSKDTVTATEIANAKPADPTPEEQATNGSEAETGADAQIVAQAEPAAETAEADAAVSAAAKQTDPVKPQSANPAGTTDVNKTTAVWHIEGKENLAAEKIDLSRQMSEMKGYWEAGNMEAVADLAYLPRYRACSLQLNNTTKYYYYGDTDDQKRPNGKGLALYADNQYYYGEWKDGVRSGSGMWMKYYVYEKTAKASECLYLAHSYTGNWSGDLPNGEGAEHFDYIEGNMQKDVGYNRNFLGNFKNGLYDGEIYITNYYSDGNVKEWNGKADNGVWKAMGAKDKLGQVPVIVELTNKENFQWMKISENKNQGVAGILSAAYSK